MKIAFTYNLQLTNNEDEAEFDRQETIDTISDIMIRQGHTVEKIEVSGPASLVVARLEALNPDLVFNTAEGKQGKYREAFYPALFDQLGFFYTGSDAYVCSVTLDKLLTKMIVKEAGVKTPNWQFLSNPHSEICKSLKYPLIVKPNYEGSSKGIDQNSVVENHHTLIQVIHNLFPRYPQGLLIEEYIEGQDIVVPFVESLSKKTKGILPPAGYVFNQQELPERKYQIYDYQLKNQYYQYVDVTSPIHFSKKTMELLYRYSEIVFQVLGVRDFGRIDYRVTPNGDVYFIEINALPSLEPGAAIYQSAKAIGLDKMDDVINSIIKSAVNRYGLKGLIKKRKASPKINIGLTYNLKRKKIKSALDDDSEAEYDSITTITAIQKAIESLGHRVLLFEATPELTSLITSADIDIVFNIAEGIKGKNRESQVPAILELLDIEFTGSDAAALSIALDKSLAKKIVSHAGILTPSFFLMKSPKDKIPPSIQFPLILKPNTEGSSKGITTKNVVHNREELINIAAELIEKYKQAVLAEEFIEGREFTVGLLGEYRPKILPPMEIVFLGQDKNNVYSFEHKLSENDEIRYDHPAAISDKLKKRIEKNCKIIFQALGCRDVARIDLRIDSRENIYFIECNPLPGLTPDWSDLCMIANSAGMDYQRLIANILAPAVKRWKNKRKTSKND